MSVVAFGEAEGVFHRPLHGHRARGRLDWSVFPRRQPATMSTGNRPMTRLSLDAAQTLREALSPNHCLADEPRQKRRSPMRSPAADGIGAIQQAGNGGLPDLCSRLNLFAKDVADDFTVGLSPQFGHALAHEPGKGGHSLLRHLRFVALDDCHHRLANVGFCHAP